MPLGSVLCATESWLYKKSNVFRNNLPFFLKGKCVYSNEMRVNTSICFNALAISEINSKCALNCILIDSIFIIKRRPEVFSAADPSVRHAAGHCDCCS